MDTQFQKGNQGIPTRRLDLQSPGACKMPNHLKEQMSHTYYTTTDYTNGKQAGAVEKITVDNQEITYECNEFGQATEIVGPSGTVTYTASGSGQSDTFLPPRFLKVNDVAGNESEFSYDDHGRLHTTTNPDDDVTTSTYDLYGNSKTLEVPASGSTALTWDIYGQLIELDDAEGSKTMPCTS